MVGPHDDPKYDVRAPKPDEWAKPNQTCERCGAPGAVLHFPGGWLCEGACKVPFAKHGEMAKPKPGAASRRAFVRARTEVQVE